MFSWSLQWGRGNEEVQGSCCQPNWISELQTRERAFLEKPSTQRKAHEELLLWRWPLTSVCRCMRMHLHTWACMCTHPTCVEHMYTHAGRKPRESYYVRFEIIPRMKLTRPTYCCRSMRAAAIWCLPRWIWRDEGGTQKHWLNGNLLNTSNLHANAQLG